MCHFGVAGDIKVKMKKQLTQLCALLPPVA